MAVLGSPLRGSASEGLTHKCPICGENIPSFTAKCPSCGYEFRELEVSSVVQEFAKQLHEIDSKRAPKSTFNQMKGEMGFSNADYYDEKKISLIQNFNVPNTKEDICEFLILATSNINENMYFNFASHQDKSFEKRLSDAWMAKANQVYSKAILSLSTDPDFANVRYIYESKIQAVNNKTKMAWVVILGILVFSMFFFLLLFALH